ncbi:MAG TPA: nuclear transport factor 2 family protein [Pyrinomonadaceae bacterium]|nr:nuclear transport factor 2 family protein [Pyrinomonadaceae bacterium]
MKRYFSFTAVLLIVFAVGWRISVQGTTVNAVVVQQAIAEQIIAREHASIEAWRRKDKSFFADLLTEDSTYFNAYSPYLATDAKRNFLPKFEQYAEQFKYLDFQMHNPRVQIYGDAAVLTYQASVTANFNGQPLNYTSKMTSVYVRQGNTWRVAHGHESLNPSPRL